MQRSFAKLASRSYDLLVVGGGVYGAWTAYDAALRGLRVALVERADWAAATSSASSKLIHGGLRYLEQREFTLVRKSLDERRRLARLGPHRVRPLRLLLPVYRGDRVGPFRLGLGLWLYDRLAGRGQPVPQHRKVGANEVAERWSLKPAGLRGGFLFGDCQTDDARFTLEIVDGAIQAGAVAVNRAQANRLLVEQGRCVGAEIEDRESGEKCKVHAGVVVNCAGPWTGELSRRFAPGLAESIRLTKGVHLVLPPLPFDHGFLLSSNEDRRVVFVLPWYGRTLIGTTDTDYKGDPERVRVESDDVAYLLDRANRLFVRPPFSEQDVIAAFAGLRTLPAAPGRSPSAVSREWHLHEPLPNLLASVGGKYTSARADAASAVDRTLRVLGRKHVPCATATRPFPWAPPEDYAAWNRHMLAAGLSLGLDEETAEWCQLRYGSRIEQLFDLICEAPELARRIVDDAPFCLAEVVHAVRHEMALTLDDVLRRRVPLLLVSRLPEAALSLVTELVAQTLRWSERRCHDEIAAVGRPGQATVEVHGPV